MKKNEEFAQWMRFAERAFELAKKGRVSKKVTYEDLCFQAEQAAEKAIKTVLIYYDIAFPKTHKIEFLLQLLQKEKIEIPKIIEKAKILTDYASDTRYPGNYDPVSIDEYKQALKLAENVLKWAKSIIERKNDKLF